MQFTKPLLAISTLPALSFIGSSAFGQETKDKPNVIILFLDDVSARDFGCYGIRDPKTTNTPYIDELSQQSVFFDYCWGTPLSGPSRSMMMTGRYATQTEWWDNDMKPQVIAKEDINEILPWVHIAISNAKRLLLDFHHDIEPQYLQNYLNEFCYKFNRRNFGDKLFDRLLIACITYKNES